MEMEKLKLTMMRVEISVYSIKREGKFFKKLQGIGDLYKLNDKKIEKIFLI